MSTTGTLTECVSSLFSRPAIITLMQSWSHFTVTHHTVNKPLGGPLESAVNGESSSESHCCFVFSKFVHNSYFLFTYNEGKHQKVSTTVFCINEPWKCHTECFDHSGNEWMVLCLGLMENYHWTPSLYWPEWLTANSTTANCSAKACATTLTQEQRASNQRPADLYVMNFHVLAGNVLHWNFLCNLKGENFF